MHTQKIIEKFGYTAAEARVYLAALTLGEGQITDIARKAGIPRTSCYFILEKLQEDGLMHYFPKRGRRYWLAENPDQLLINLRAQEAALKEVMPVLHGMRFHGTGKTTVKLFEGQESLALIFKDVLETKRHFLFSIPQENFGRNFSEELADFMKKSHAGNLLGKILINSGPSAHALKKSLEEETRHMRFLSKTAELGSGNLIYGNKVAILSPLPRPLIVLIESKLVAETAAIFFDALWNQGDLF